MGCTAARLYTPPLRPLNRKTSLGYQIADWAELWGEPLLPWQRWAAIHAMETMPGGSLRFGIILIIVARQNGKSQLKRVVTSWRMYNRPRSSILGTAQDASFAKEQWDFVRDTIGAHPDLAAEVTKVSLRTGSEWFRLANGSRYKIAASNSKAARGGGNAEANIDELRTQTDWKGWAAISATTAAQPDGQTWAMSNAGDDSSVVLNQLRAAALARADPRICILEWSAPYDEETAEYCELDDQRGWRQANPGLGYIMSPAVLQTALTDPPEIFRTERLCQRVVNLATAIDMGAWKDSADAGTIQKGARLAAVFDIAPDGKHASLLAATKQADGRCRAQVIQAWNTAAEARTDLPMLLTRLKPARFGWFASGPGAEMADVLRPLATKINTTGKREPEWLPDSGEITGHKAVECCMGLAGIVRARQIVHAGEALLDAQIGGAVKLPSGDGWRFTRQGRGHCDAAYACAGAVHVALTMPAVARARIRVLTA